MTENEAIEYLKITSGCAEDGSVGELQKQMCDIAISALKEIQQYWKIGTIEECWKAVGKQKVIPVSVGIQNFYECPKCQSVLRNTDKYCRECGQAISFEESKEE